ncbi:tyrosine-type recombinase/integrase [Bacillus mycoides]|uniref:tyrosine-type recombinase/integrase n=1 Tax=Bacillus mycoides TaxID=1405 RepID=UPI000993C5AA|nr:tyrosine-type recombinase/integrase [Bacillus mycoides]OOR15769.1 hypothetical protein BW891_24525 [Bacillus mycoides]
MNVVEPIRDIQKIEEFLAELKNWNEKYYVLAFAGFYSGLRISDLLVLRVADVRDLDHFIVKEQKTGNTRRIKLNPQLKEVLTGYIKDKADDEYLFRQRDVNAPISRQYAHKMLSAAAKKVGIKDKISTHSLRKSFGYHMYKQTKDVVLLQEIFGHSAPSVTLRYIGYTSDMIDVAMDNFRLV